MTYCVGTMNTGNGWETKSVPEAMARHLTYFFTSRRSQGIVIGEVPSFYYIHQTYGQNPTQLTEETMKALQAYFAELWPGNGAVLVNAERKTIEGQVNNYHLIISIRVIHEGKGYDMAETLLVNRETYDRLIKGRKQ